MLPIRGLGQDSRGGGGGCHRHRYGCRRRRGRGRKWRVIVRGLASAAQVHDHRGLPGASVSVEFGRGGHRLGPDLIFTRKTESRRIGSHRNFPPNGNLLPLVMADAKASLDPVANGWAEESPIDRIDDILDLHNAILLAGLTSGLGNLRHLGPFILRRWIAVHPGLWRGQVLDACKTN